MLYGDLGPNDIKQGRCGDCYFLASLSALAEYPERIKRIFLTQTINEAGCYAVQLYINGERRTVVVDDYFPYDSATETWAFSQPSRVDNTRLSEIWVLVLEKAWAKVFGSYQRIEGGSAGEALYPLTGSPQTQFYHDEITDLDGFWERLYASDRKKMPMCCCTYSEADNQVTRRQIQEAGLQDCHAYSLIGAKIVTTADLVEHRLLKIRNPYGMKEWNGDWSDKSRKWTVKTREQVNCEDREDGCFFISLEDFIKFFTRTTICYYVDNYEDNFLED